MTRAALTLGLALALVSTAGVSQAQVPEKMDYQVMLTDAANQPLADQAVTLVFRIYTLAVGGSQLWTETQSVTTNSIGVVSVVLGSVNPLTVSFTAPRWLQVEVNGEIMSPRRELVAAPYARQADNADRLGGTAAGSFALSSTLSTAGTINSPGNPVDWTKLKSVPAGFADGTDNAGTGDGNSLDAPDGSPVNALYIDSNGNVVVNDDTPFEARLQVRAPRNTTGLHIVADSDAELDMGAFVNADSTSSIVANCGGIIESMTTTVQPTAVVGYGFGVARGAYFRASGTADALHASASLGHSGLFEGGAGVDVTREDGYPALKVENEQLSGVSDAAWFSSAAGVSNDTWTLYSHCYEGRAGTFGKSTDDDQYAVRVSGAGSTAEGLYVWGSIYSTVPFATGALTSRGTEAVFGVTAPNVEITDSGAGRLTNGEARVAFDRIFAESITGAADLRITATPVGAWSGLYVERIDGEGFTLRSAAGEKNVEFHWAAVGRAKDHRERPDITIPDPAEDARIAAEKAAAVKASRSHRTSEEPTTVTRTVGE